jgi:putative spermidine/putrescine transport system ATP-binding protein
VAQASLKLKTVSLAKNYGPYVALAGADIAMEEGEFLTLLGPSGSGKTTLLSMIAGLIQPDSGEIWIDGRNATYLPTKKRDIGLVFQNYALFPHLTVFENVAFPLRMRRRSETEIGHAVARALEIVRLPELRDRLPSELSGGQQQRVALARCFVYRPSIILMDEPLGALDKKLRDHMQIEIVRLAREVGASVIYVTHDQEEALVMSDRICLINEGRIEQIGTPHELYFAPRTVFAASFIGESNVIDVTTASDGSTRLANGVPLGGRHPALGEGPAKIVLRPESLNVLSSGEDADYAFDGRIESILLTGALTRIHARLMDGSKIVVALPSRVQGLRITVGETVRFGFDAGAAIVVGRSGVAAEAGP